MLVDDPDTDAILLFLETIRRPDLFEEAARRAHAAGKPIVAYKLGRSEAAAQLATTHTGALAGSDAAADAFFRAVGIVRVDQIETLLELPPLLLGRAPPVRPNAPSASSRRPAAAARWWLTGWACWHRHRPYAGHDVGRREQGFRRAGAGQGAGRRRRGHRHRGDRQFSAVPPAGGRRRSDRRTRPKPDLRLHACRRPTQRCAC